MHFIKQFIKYFSQIALFTYTASIFQWSCHPINPVIKKVYLVRHADRLGELDRLSSEGIIRSKKLSEILKTKQIDALYSTATDRTIETIKPFSEKTGLPIWIYDPTDQLSLYNEIINDKTHKNFLIVGHSNTVPKLTSLFFTKADTSDIHKNDYSRIYTIIIRKNSKSQMKINHY